MNKVISSNAIQQYGLLRLLTLLYRFNSEGITPIILKLKVEINCREHFSILGYKEKKFIVDSDWYKGECNIQTYKLEELLGTKIRALYQRKKGRDLYDLYKAVSTSSLSIDEIINCYQKYMEFVVDNPPSQKQFLQNIETKMQDNEFLDDTKSLLRPNENYNHNEAYKIIKSQIIEKL